MRRRIGNPEVTRAELWNRQVQFVHSHNIMIHQQKQMKQSKILLESIEAQKQKTKELLCVHPEDAVRCIIRGSERRLECGKCGKTLFKEDLSKSNFNSTK